MVRTVNTDTHAIRNTLVAVGTGGLLAATLAGLGIVSATPADAAESTAFGVRASGNDNKSANSGSLSGTSFSASGISTETRPGYAKASVGSLTVGGKAIGSVSATCEQGVSKVTHSGAAQNTDFFKVSYGTDGGPSAIGVTVTIADAKGKTSQTITAAGVSCGKAEGQPPTSTPPSGEPTAKPGHEPTRTPQYGKRPDRKATPVKPQPGHQAVTG